MKRRGYYLVLSLMLVCGKLWAADYAREQRWADELLPGVLVGEEVYLQQRNQHRFLGLLAEADKASIALIVVHGMGIHPDWGMVSTLRQSLFEQGYTTLSIQMPVLAADASPQAYPALFPEAAERLTLAVQFLRQRGYRNVVIVSHSQGSRMTRYYMEQRPGEVAGWAAISLTQGDTFAGINTPILDLYADGDLPHVLDSVAVRRSSLANAYSRQQVITGTDHFFAGREAAMVLAVKDFLLHLELPTASQVSALTFAPAVYCPTF